MGTPAERNGRTHSQPGAHVAVAAHAAGMKATKSCHTRKFVLDESIGIHSLEVGRGGL